jgi:lipopolysaccharide export system protein LptC
MNRVWIRAWDRLSLYLPVVLMGVFALGTWWLVRNTPGAPAALTAAAPRHEADYFLRSFTLRSFDAQGQLKREVSADRADHYPDTDTLEMLGVRILAFDDGGAQTRATAREAISNRDGSEVQLRGAVHVQRDGGALAAPLQYRGEFLLVQTRPERLSSPQPVEISRGTDRFFGDSLRYDGDSATLELVGRVRGVIQPRSPGAPRR